MKAQLTRLVQRLEEEYIGNASEQTKAFWLSAQNALTKVVNSKAEKKLLFSKVTFYEEGEQSGRLLAKIVNVGP